MSIIIFFLLSIAISCNWDSKFAGLTQNESLGNKTLLELRIDSLNKKAWAERRYNPKSKLIAEQALDNSKDINYSIGIGDACKTLGSIEVNKGKTEAGLSLLYKALDFYKKADDKQKICALHLSFGHVLKNIGELDKAAEHYYEGLSLSELINYKVIYGHYYSAIANLENELKNPEAAKKQYHKAINYHISNNDTLVNLAKTYYNYASLLTETNELDSALMYFNVCEKIFIDHNERSFLSNIYSGKAGIMIQKDEYKEALNLYTKSLNLKKNLGDVTGIINSYPQIGEAYKGLKKFKEASAYYSTGIDLATENNMPILLSKMYLSLSEVNEALGEYPIALENFKNHDVISDSLYNLDSEARAKEIEIRYNNEKLQIDNNLQKSVLKQQDTLISGVVLSLILVIIIALLTVNFYRQKKSNAILINKQNEKIHQQKLASLSQEAELRSFNALVDGQEKEKKRIAEILHDSTGSMLSAVQMHFNSLSKQIVLESEEQKFLWNKTLELIQETASYNKVLAYQMMPPVLIKFGLPAAVSYLCDRVRGSELSITSDIYGFSNRLPEKMELIIFRAIDELLNNVIKHARASEVEIQLTLHENELNVILQDNGIGFDFDPLDSSFGMGINSVQSRIKHFKGTFNIDSNPGSGTTIIINVPINLK